MPDSFPEEAAAGVHPFRPLTPEQIALLEWSPNAKLVFDRHARIRYVNAAALHNLAFRTEPAELIGREIWDVFLTLQLSIVRRAYTEVLESGEATRLEGHDIDADRWLSVYAYPADDGVVAVLEDITEQRRTVHQLRRNEETLLMAQEAANIGSFELDTASNTWVWSDQLVRLMGHDPATLDQNQIGRDPNLRFTHPDDAGRVAEALRRAVETGRRQALTVRIVRPDGEVRHLHITTMRVDGADEASSRLVGTALDISEQVHAEAERARIDAQMQQAQKLESLGVLAGGIAHDFNNLLVGILGNASLAMLDTDMVPSIRECLQEIERSAQKAAELTRQLLAYAGKGRYHVESLDATATIDEMASLLRAAVSRNAALYFDLPEHLPPLEADLNQFRQVIMALVANASDALDERPGEVSVVAGVQEVSQAYLDSCVPGSVAEPGRYVYVEVRDTGVGMDAATRQRMFEPFFSTKFTGRGLGLAATIGIMRGHRGAIRVSSELGTGTSVRLLFPISGVATPPSTPALSDRWMGEGHILVIDDEESVRAVASSLLRRRGFTVTVARDGLEGITLFASAPHTYTLVLLDLTMPTLNGEETLHALREQRPDVDVLLMSGYNEADVSRLFAGRELSGFLQKPFNATELYAAVAQALTGWAQIEG